MSNATDLFDKQASKVNNILKKNIPKFQCCWTRDMPACVFDFSIVTYRRIDHEVCNEPESDSAFPGFEPHILKSCQDIPETKKKSNSSKLV